MIKIFRIFLSQAGCLLVVACVEIQFDSLLDRPTFS